MPVREVLLPAVIVRGVLLRVLLDGVCASLWSGGPSRSSVLRTFVYCAADEKYFGIIRARSGRIAGRHAQMMATLTSTDDSVACAVLSKDRSLLFATSSRE